MGFEDFFEDKRRHHGNQGEYEHHDDHHNYGYPPVRRYPLYENQGHLTLLSILNKIRNNKKLKIIVALAVIILLIIAISLIVVLLPLILKLFNYISQNGIQGIVDGVTGFLDKLMKGSGK